MKNLKYKIEDPLKYFSKQHYEKHIYRSIEFNVFLYITCYDFFDNSISHAIGCML